MTDQRPIRRALISVYDKTGLADLAAGLHEAGIEIVSTGSTAATRIATSSTTMNGSGNRRRQSGTTIGVSACIKSLSRRRQRIIQRLMPD